MFLHLSATISMIGSGADKLKNFGQIKDRYDLVRLVLPHRSLSHPLPACTERAINYSVVEIQNAD
jgi:hypothetical protein